MRKQLVLLSFIGLLGAAAPAAADEPPAPPTETPPPPADAPPPAAEPAPAAPVVVPTSTANPVPTVSPVAAAATVATSTEVKKEAPMRFYGLGMDISLWDGTNLNAVNYSNILNFLFEPTWQFGKTAFAGTRFSTMALAGRFALDVPLVTYDESLIRANTDNGRAMPCSNLTPSTNGGQIDPNAVQRCPYERSYKAHQGDLLLTLRNPKLFTIPYAKINVSPSITMTLPTSAEAQFQNLYLGLGGGIGVSRSFLDGKINVGYSFGASKSFRSSNTADAGNPTPLTDPATGTTSTDPRFLADTRLTGSYGFRHVFSVDFAPTEKLSFAALYILIDTFKYPGQCDATVNGQPHDLCAAGDMVAANSGSNIISVGHSDFQVLWVTAGYQLMDWLNLNIAWINWAPQRHPDGSARQPFYSFDYNAFTSISFGATVSIEKAAAKVF